MRPIRRPGHWRGYLPGIFILLGIISVSTAVFFLDTIRRALVEGPEIVVLASEARGLVPGADVWVAGAPSGRVTGVFFGSPKGRIGSRVVVHATLNWAAVPFLRSDTRATISSSSLLAPVVLKLDPGSPDGGPFDFADTLAVPVARSADYLLALAGTAREAVDTLSQLSLDLAESLADGPGTAASLRRDTALIGRMKILAGHAGAISSALRSENSLPARIAADSLGHILASMAATLSDLRGEERAAEATRTVTDLADRLERISTNLDRLDRDLRAGRGTAGRALYDDELTRQQEAFYARMDSLKTQLRSDPWRWLRFKLF
ncbi:MAG: MCE family protein [Gemmatimonadetes bacterium]|nr:MCE family protein [Gemmatimonadota bacterium]